MKFFTDESWEKVSDENKDILDDYVMELEVQGKAEKTIYQYQSDIKGFLCWNAEHNKDKYLLDLKRKDFIKFQLGQTRAGTSNARINRFQSSIRNLLQYCVMEEDEYPDYQVNPMALIKGLEKKKVKKVYFLTDQQVSYLIYKFLIKGKTQIALWVSMSYDTGARRNEILQISKKGILDRNHTNEVVGKRGKRFKLIYSNRTKALAKQWLEERGDDEVDSLWAVGHGKSVHAIKYSTFYDWSIMCGKILKEKDGKDYKFGPHTFRHTALERFSDGTHYYARHELGKTDGMDINLLKNIAHHSDISTTQSYLQDKSIAEMEQEFGVKLTD